MAATRITPDDRLTGLPLPIAPRCEELPMDRPQVADWHHGFHPRRELEGRGLAKMALRNIAMQKVERELHNEGPYRYHRFFRGPELPKSTSEIFARCVMASAGFIPHRVIDLTHVGGPRIRNATPDEKAFLHTPSDDDDFGYKYVRYNYGPVRDFFREYVIRQQLTRSVRPELIDDFLKSSDEEERLTRGRELLVEAIDLATGSIREQYIHMKRREMLHPAAAADPIQYLHDRLGNEEQKDELLPQLHNKLLIATAA